jgi:hypothetical protein
MEFTVSDTYIKKHFSNIRFKALGVIFLAMIGVAISYTQGSNVGGGIIVIVIFTIYGIPYFLELKNSEKIQTAFQNMKLILDLDKESITYKFSNGEFHFQLDQIKKVRIYKPYSKWRNATITFKTGEVLDFNHIENKEKLYDELQKKLGKKIVKPNGLFSLV